MTKGASLDRLAPPVIAGILHHGLGGNRIRRDTVGVLGGSVFCLLRGRAHLRLLLPFLCDLFGRCLGLGGQSQFNINYNCRPIAIGYIRHILPIIPLELYITTIVAIVIKRHKICSLTQDRVLYP